MLFATPITHQTYSTWNSDGNSVLIAYKMQHNVALVGNNMTFYIKPLRAGIYCRAFK